MEPLLISEELSQRVDSLLERWKQKRDNDLMIGQQFGQRLQQSMNQLIQSFKCELEMSFVDQKWIDCKLKHLGEVCDDIHRMEQLFEDMDNRFNATRSLFYVRSHKKVKRVSFDPKIEKKDEQLAENVSQTSKSESKPLKKSEELSKRIDSVINRWTDKRVEDLKNMERFENRLQQCLRQLIIEFEENLKKTYADEEQTGHKLERLSKVLEDIRKIEDVFQTLENRFNAIKALVFTKTTNP